MTAASNVIIGVISGVFTAALLWIAHKLYTNSILPWYQAMLYPGIKISGKWLCNDSELNQRIQLELKQKANSISGRLTLVAKTQSSLSYDGIRSFDVSGSIFDRFVYLHGKAIGDRMLGMNSFLLEVKGDGKKMTGCITFIRIMSHEIDNCQILLLHESCQTSDSDDLSEEFQLKILKKNLRVSTTSKLHVINTSTPRTTRARTQQPKAVAPVK